MTASAQKFAPKRQESAYGTEEVHRWADLKEFHDASDHDDGYHVIEGAHGAPLELLAIGRPFEQASGAVMVVFRAQWGSARSASPPSSPDALWGPSWGFR